MRRPSMCFQLLIAIAAFASADEAAVIATFNHPDTYADVGWHRGGAQDTLKEMERYLQRLGETYLAPGQMLKIEVLDIDLAGQERFRRRGCDHGVFPRYVGGNGQDQAIRCRIAVAPKWA